MLKFVGILRNRRLKTVLQRFRIYHPPLYRLLELAEGSAASLVARSEEFSGILNDVIIGGVWKRTGPGRLTQLDQWVASYVPTAGPAPFAMLDVGGSDGSTTFDMVNTFKASLGVKAIATILEKQLRLRMFQRGPVRYYLTEAGNPLFLQIGILGALLEPTKAREGLVFNPIVRMITRVLHRFRLEEHLLDRGDIYLQSPLAKHNPDIIWLERDLFQLDPQLCGSFDYIRCCNVLNCGYFAPSQIREAIDVLTRYLKPEGLLLLARTQDGPLHCEHTASLWKHSPSGLRHIADLNGGSETNAVMTFTQ